MEELLQTIVIHLKSMKMLRDDTARRDLRKWTEGLTEEPAIPEHVRMGEISVGLRMADKFMMPSMRRLPK